MIHIPFVCKTIHIDLDYPGEGGIRRKERSQVKGSFTLVKKRKQKRHGFQIGS